MSRITKKTQIRTLACQTATVRRTTHGERERGRGEREPRAAGGTAPENSPEVQNYPVPQQRHFSCLREQNKNTSSTRSTQPTCTAAPFTAGETWGWPGRPTSGGGVGSGGAYTRRSVTQPQRRTRPYQPLPHGAASGHCAQRERHLAGQTIHRTKRAQTQTQRTP